MYIKIYFNDKPVYLCDEINADISEILHQPDTIFIDEASNAAINSLLHEIQKKEFCAGVLKTDDLEVLKKAFFKHFKVINAAGGIVENEADEILFIYRLDKWDLPKGKLEDNETLEECAVREVEEETGLRNIKLIEKTGETYHTYNAFGKQFLKISHWYKMFASKNQALIPQTEEDITTITWIAKNNIELPLANTYPSIKDILAIALKN